MGRNPFKRTVGLAIEIPYGERLEALLEFSECLLDLVKLFPNKGHALEVGHSFILKKIPEVLSRFNQKKRHGKEPIPWLAALVCASPFDLALHDAYGVVNEVPIYEAYGAKYLNQDLSFF